MAIFNTYSKRQKELPDVFTYDVIQDKLKTQIFHIWNDYFKQGCFPKDLVNKVQTSIYSTICKEEGVKTLYYDTFSLDSPDYQVEHYFEKLEEPNKIIDVIEITFRYIELLESITKKKYPYQIINYPAISAIKDLNRRFLENGVGYEYTGEQIIRIENKLLHNEVIQQTISLISTIEYKNANEEFLKAHEHFRFNRYQECLNECLKAFETTMKIVIKKNDWELKETDSARFLIKKLIENNFFKSYDESHLCALRNLLEGQIPTIRNKNSGHGQGNVRIEVPKSLASYMLYITGSTINLIVELQREKEGK